MEPEPLPFKPSNAVEAAALAHFDSAVKPVLRENCYQCHFGLNRKGGLNMGVRALLIRGGKHGPAVVPGHPNDSLLVRLIKHQGPPEHPMSMPPKNEDTGVQTKLSDADIALIEGWIRDGAIMDR